MTGIWVAAVEAGEEGHLAARVGCSPRSKCLITALGGSWVPQTYLSGPFAMIENALALLKWDRKNVGLTNHQSVQMTKLWS